MSDPRTVLTENDIRRLIDDLEGELESTAPEERDGVYASATQVFSKQEVSPTGASLASERLGDLVKRFGIRWTLSLA
jgi:hypothetical protein